MAKEYTPYMVIEAFPTNPICFHSLENVLYNDVNGMDIDQDVLLKDPEYMVMSEALLFGMKVLIAERFLATL
ncbi:MAG: hypothetical protein AMDU2_EPLC00014G0026 [Thermoplasmatales archaeon E-plasma]|nr:MAG: hypothetical protein AMDU2_EPLC00014G0026 [Thermoplasmatales archaeon E-plasma]